MTVDANKVAMASQLSGLIDLGPADLSASIGAQVIGANGNAATSVTFTLPAAQAIAVLRVNWGGLTYSSLQNFWIKCPDSVTFIDSLGHACQLKMSYTRTGNQITVNLSIGYSSGTCTIPNLNISVHARFYALPF